MESDAPKHKAQPPLSFGLLLNPELATSVLERGPSADSPKVISPLFSVYVCVMFCFFSSQLGSECNIKYYKEEAHLFASVSTQCNNVPTT